MFYLIPFILFAVFVGLPVASVVFFVINLIKYCDAKEKNKLTMHSIRRIRLRPLLQRLIVSGVIAAVLVSFSITFTVLITIGLSHM